MSVVQLTILTAINMIGSGIIMLPANLAQVGTISILSWLVTAVGSMALAYAFAQCGMFSSNSGGMGGYAEYSFGKSGSFMSNYTYGVSLVIANASNCNFCCRLCVSIFRSNTFSSSSRIMYNLYFMVSYSA